MSTKLRELSHEIHSISRHAQTRIVALYGRRGGISTGIIWSADNHVVAASHTLERDEGIDVVLVDGTAGRGDVVGRDPSTDVALLRVSEVELADPAWDTADQPDVGALSVVVAASLHGPSVRLTNLTSVDDAWTTSGGGRISRYLESSVPIFRGFSGSPLLDADGRLLGMNTTGLERRKSLAIPTKTLQRVVDSLREHGRIRRGFLGVATYPVRLPEPSAQRFGLIVLSVQPKSPAAKAGIHLGDVLLSFDGAVVDSPMRLLSRLNEDSIGKRAQVEILRAGTETTLEVELAARP